MILYFGDSNLIMKDYELMYANLFVLHYGMMMSLIDGCLVDQENICSKISQLKIGKNPLIKCCVGKVNCPAFEGLNCNLKALKSD